jgi:hypothetical protein
VLFNIHLCEVLVVARAALVVWRVGTCDIRISLTENAKHFLREFMQTGSHSHYTFSGDFLVFAQDWLDTERQCRLIVKGSAGRVAPLSSAAREVQFQFENLIFHSPIFTCSWEKKVLMGGKNGIIDMSFRHVFCVCKLTSKSALPFATSLAA